MVLNKDVSPKCQIKWEEIFGTNIPCENMWSGLKFLKIENKVKEFQWKSLHNILYTEERLKKMKISNGKCHICQNDNNIETLQHLFFSCCTSQLILKTSKKYWSNQT